MKALLVIDVQKGLMCKKIYNKQLFISAINKAISSYELKGDCIVKIQHNNKMLIENTKDWELDENIIYKGNHKIVQKVHGDAFEGTDLKEYLEQKNIKEILVCGLVSHGCVKATCIGGLEKGFRVNVLRNGHSCWSSDAKEKIKDTERELELLGINTIDE